MEELDTTSAMAAPILTTALLAAIRKQPNLPQNTWYFIAATTLSALNRPDELPNVYKHAVEASPDIAEAIPGRDEQLSISRRIREALLKASAVGGAPDGSTRYGRADKRSADTQDRDARGPPRRNSWGQTLPEV